VANGCSASFQKTRPRGPGRTRQIHIAQDTKQLVPRRSSWVCAIFPHLQVLTPLNKPSQNAQGEEGAAVHNTGQPQSAPPALKKAKSTGCDGVAPPWLGRAWRQHPAPPSGGEPRRGTCSWSPLAWDRCSHPPVPVTSRSQRPNQFPLAASKNSLSQTMGNKLPGKQHSSHQLWGEVA